MPPILQVRDVSKRFGHLVIADDISFSAEQGSALGIVGPNGAGKSTLLSMISGALPPDSGTIHYDGHDITKLSAAVRSDLGIARSFQVPRPFPNMIVFENVCVAAAFGGHSHGQAGYDAAAVALEIVGLLHLWQVPAGQLRLLDRKRLELARALATQPKVILLDELAGGLTDRELPPLIEMIRGIRDSGITVLWIEHIVRALTAVVDQLVCLAFGKILAIGQPREVLRSPEVVQAYLGSTLQMEEAW